MSARKNVINNAIALKFDTDSLIDAAFVFYFSARLISQVFIEILEIFDAEFLEDYFTVIAVYSPVVLACLFGRKKKIPADCIALIAGCLLFFGISLLIHPEYGQWYSREKYGAWSYVFYPTEAIYAYLFIRLVNDPKRIIRNMKIAGWIMYVYFCKEIEVSLRRGYWYGVGKVDQIHSSYSVAFGYNVLLFAMVFLYEAVMYRRLPDIAGSCIGVFMILSYGSRGPMLCIAIFLAVMCLNWFLNSKKKWLIVCMAIPAVLLALLFYEDILQILARLLSALNISSRFLTKLLNGTIADDNSRNEIWQAAVQMIRDNPFGYGAMGSQPVLFAYTFAGYPHSVILDMLIDFGVFGGGMILMFLFVNAVRMLLRKENEAWRGAFIVFFCTACQLFISLCFWSATAFWAAIAVGVNCHIHKKQKRMKAQTADN